MNANEELIMIDGIPLGKTLLSFATYCLGKKVSETRMETGQWKHVKNLQNL